MTYLPQLHRSIVAAAERLEHDAGAGHGRGARIAEALRGLGRRRLLIVAACGALLAGSAATAVAVLGGRESAAPSGRLSSTAGAGSARRFVVGNYDVGAYPDFVGGAAGWCVWVGYRQSRPVSAGKLPAAQRGPSTGAGAVTYGCADGNPIVSAVAAQGKDTVNGVTTITTAAILMTTPQVAAVRISPAVTILTRADSALPDGYRLALEVQQTSAKGRLHRPDQFRQPVALDVNGRAIAVKSALVVPSDAAVNWQRSAVGTQERLPNEARRPPAGACEIDTGGVRGAHPVAGQVVQHVHGFPGLPGTAYLTCATVYFNYRGAPATAAVLLDARHPGTAPASFPYATALSANVETVEQPDWSLATFSARRVGPAAWLIVQASGSLAARLAILDRLRACVSLTRGCG
jgi:hypothetical protein